MQKAFTGFFKKQTKHPIFKRKGEHDSFYLGGDHIQVKGDQIKIPKLGWVKMREALRFSGHILSATISRTAHHWFVSLCILPKEKPTPCESQASVGVDLGLNHFATLSTGEIIAAPKPLRGQLKKLKRMQRRLARQVKGSKRREKQKEAIALQHYKIRCIRQDAIHKTTTMLTSQFKNIVIEDLNVRGMMKNHRLALSISDVGFYEFKRQLIYKAELKGNVITIADRWFPSSKKCCCCGEIKSELTLACRVYECDQCHQVIDRDLNAAINLKNLLSTGSSPGINAHGQDGSAILHSANCNQLG